MNLYDIVTLYNKDYVISQQVFYNDKEYLLLIEVDENEDLLEEKLIVEKVKSKEGYGIKEIKDSEIYKEVKSRIVDLLLN